MRRRQEQTLDAHGQTLVTKFVIGRHRHEAVDMLKDAVGPGSATAAYRLMETLLGTPRSAHGSEYKPAGVVTFAESNNVGVEKSRKHLSHQ